MDRLMVYPGAIPLDTDILSVERNVMTALGWLTQAALGTATGVVGLACNPTVPASMTVNIGPGALWAQEVIDQSNFGSLPADTSALMKMGILPEAGGTNFTLTAPTTSGQSINYLIEAAFAEADTNPIVLPYVNPANPSQPFTGPNNAGTPQNTVRAQHVALQLKAGVAANTGTQTTPSVDAGYVGLYVITVNFGQTVINAVNITLYANAPFSAGPFAPVAGNVSQSFSVGPATQPTQAVPLAQVTAAINGLASQGWTTAQIASAVSGVLTQTQAAGLFVPLANGFRNIASFLNAGTFTFTVPPGVTVLRGFLFGAGGGGERGTTNGSSSYGGSGGGGGGVLEFIVAVTPGQQIPIVIGAGGIGGGPGLANATGGGASSFGALATCTGGGPGGAEILNVGVGGVGGTASYAAAVVPGVIINNAGGSTGVIFNGPTGEAGGSGGGWNGGSGGGYNYGASIIKPGVSGGLGGGGGGGLQQANAGNGGNGGCIIYM